MENKSSNNIMKELNKIANERHRNGYKKTTEEIKKEEIELKKSVFSEHRKKIYENSDPEILKEISRNGFYSHTVTSIKNDSGGRCKYLYDLMHILNANNELPGKLFSYETSNYNHDVNCGILYNWSDESLKEQLLS